MRQFQEADAVAASLTAEANRLFRAAFPHRKQVTTKELEVRDARAYHGTRHLLRFSTELDEPLINPDGPSIRKCGMRVIEDLLKLLEGRKFEVSDETPLLVLDDRGDAWGTSIERSEPVIVVVTVRPIDYALRVQVDIRASVVVGGADPTGEERHEDPRPADRPADRDPGTGIEPAAEELPAWRPQWRTAHHG